MQDYVEGASPPVPTLSLPILAEEFFYRYDKDTSASSWVFTMPARELAKLYQRVGKRLFARNIRGFLGLRKSAKKNIKDVNGDMMRTLKKDPQPFWYFNNGVTLICDDARAITEGGKKYLRVSNPQIINGQQTTRVLAEHPDNKATLLVRMVMVPRGSEAAQSRYRRFVGEIVAATNWQNSIGQEDLRANDIEQVRLERELRKLTYHYVRKRETKSEARVSAGKRMRFYVKKGELAQAVAAVLLDPYEVRRGKEWLFGEEIYPQIFDRGWSAGEYLSAYWLSKLVSTYSRGDKRLGYAKWLVLHFLWLELEDFLRSPALRTRFLQLAENQDRFRRELKPLERAIAFAFKAAMNFYRSNRVTEKGVLDESNFFKRAGLHNGSMAKGQRKGPRFSPTWRAFRHLVAPQIKSFGRSLRSGVIAAA